MKRAAHYIDAGHEPPDPGSPMNDRILAALDEAVSRSDSARRTLDAVDVVLGERPKRRQRAPTALDRPTHVIAGEDSVEAAGGTVRRRRHARASSRPRAVEIPRDGHVATGHERSTCDVDARDEQAREKVA